MIVGRPSLFSIAVQTVDGDNAANVRLRGPSHSTTSDLDCGYKCNLLDYGAGTLVKVDQTLGRTSGVDRVV